MKLLSTALVVLAALFDIASSFNIGGRSRVGFGSFIHSALRKTRIGTAARSNVPRVSVQNNAMKLDRFLMNTFSTRKSGNGGISRFGSVNKMAGRARPGVRSEEMYDVLLVLDSSGSIGSGEFLKAKQFMTDIVSLLPSTISRDNTRIACISFSDANKIKTEFSFLTHTNKNAVIQAINRIPYQNGGSTHTTQALQKAKQLLDSQGRRGAQKALFIATDGRSNGGGNPAVPANQLKNSDRADTKIVVVAVSHNVNVNEVQAIASSPAADHVYYVNSFTQSTHVTSMVNRQMKSRGFVTGIRS